MRSIAIVAILFFAFLGFGQNLIVDPGAEQSPIGNGWTVVQGNWTQENQYSAGIIPHGGTWHFMVPGSCAQESSTGKPSELYQDIDVSAYASDIDAGTAQFVFSGWVATYQNQDYSRMVVEYRSASNTILSTYDSGYLKKTSWTKYTDTRTAPATTRIIRIRLISKCGTTGADDDGYYDDLSLTIAITAPITLLYFEAEKLDHQVLLSWQTAQESNNKSFTLNKSIDGTSWQTIATIAGAGNTKLSTSYKFYDNYPSEGEQYYQLIQTDLDGTNTTYPVRFVNFILDTGTQPYVYTNSENKTIVHGVNINMISVYTMNGQLVSQYTPLQGDDIEDLELPNLPVGVLLFSIETTQETTHIKYMVK